MILTPGLPGFNPGQVLLLVGKDGDGESRDVVDGGRAAVTPFPVAFDQLAPGGHDQVLRDGDEPVLEPSVLNRALVQLQP